MFEEIPRPLIFARRKRSGNLARDRLEADVRLAGMVPTMMILRMQLGTAADPATAAFWFVMLMALLAGAIVAYPMNWRPISSTA